MKYLIALLSRWFESVEQASRPTWEYRIRYSTEKNTWVIELKETENQGWIAMSRRSAETEHELHVVRFDSYNTAKAEVLKLGLDNAYVEAQYTGMHRVTPGGVREPHALPSMAHGIPGRSGVVRPLAHNHS